jgi:transcription elongation factor Elf1
MAEELPETDKAKKQKPLEVTFTCQRCMKRKRLEEMRTITRFVPVLVVCRDCEKEIR